MEPGFLQIARLAYLAPMKPQTIFNVVIAIAVGYIVFNPSFNTITCTEWRVVDKDGKGRIGAGTFADGQASVGWVDKDGKTRINAGTWEDGAAAVVWFDKDRKQRIVAGTFEIGRASCRERV